MTLLERAAAHIVGWLSNLLPLDMNDIEFDDDEELL